jgi:hypothetical protein
VMSQIDRLHWEWRKECARRVFRARFWSSIYGFVGGLATVFIGIWIAGPPQ